MTSEDPGSEPEPDTVDCPECGNPARVLARFGHAGVDYLRIRCNGQVPVLVTAGPLRSA